MDGWRVEVIKGRDLDASLGVAWEDLRRDIPEVRSPFFACEYTRIMAAQRDDVEVGVIRREGRVVGFFPFQRTGRTAIPIGGSLTDFQGVVIHGEDPLSPAELLRGCRLNSWSFRYLTRGWSALEPFRYRRLRSPVIGLSEGFATFERSLASRGSDLMYKSNRSLRSLAKKVGPARFELDCRSPECLNRLLTWKAQQHRSKGTHFTFDEPWARAAVDRIANTHRPDFSGLVSCLYFGDHFVGGMLGLRSGPTLHAWVTSYDPEFSKFSPGLHVFVQLIRAAANAGVTRLDLGHGDEPFKFRLTAELDEVAEGCVDRRVLTGWAHRCLYQARRHVLDSSIRPWIQRLKQRGRKLRSRFAASVVARPADLKSGEDGDG